MMPIYLDNAATSFPKAPGVADAVAELLSTNAGNPGRGGHQMTLAASRMVEEARDRVARLLGGDPERTLFGPGATFWLNTVLEGWLAPGDRVVISALEHNAVMRPLRHLEVERGVQVEVVAGAAANGVPSAEEVAEAVAVAPTRLVVLTHVSNVSGAVLPIAEIVAAVAPVPVLADGAQAAGSIPVDVAASGVAAYAASTHKGLLGPAGCGVLLLADGADVEPLVRGGTGSRSESEEMPPWLPDRLEAGTPPTAAIAGVGAACRWLEREGVATLHQRTAGLAKHLAARLMEIPGVRVIGRAADGEYGPTVSFTVDGRDSGELAAWLDRERGLMLRVGLHCAPAAHRRLGTFPDGTLRAGLGPFTTGDDVAALIAAVREDVETRGH